VDLFDVVGDLAGIGEGLCGLWMLASGQQSGDGVLTDLETLANDRVVQWVEVSSGASWQVTRTISATVPLGKAGLRPRPFAITRPRQPFVSNLGPPPPQRVRVHLAPTSDLMVGQALRGP
jgi:hypothetical protein